MKTAYSLYFGAIISLFIANYTLQAVPLRQFSEAGKAHPQVQAFLADLEAPVDATAGPAEQRSFQLGYISRATVSPGFRLTHDPLLGKEIIVTGPTAALDYLQLSNDEGRFSPDFTRPVRLRERVEVRINLEAHGSEWMRIDLLTPKGQVALPPDLVTTGPLRFRMLELRKLPDHPIMVETTYLAVPNREPLSYLTGTTDHLELLQYAEDTAAFSPTKLKATTVITTKIKADN